MTNQEIMKCVKQHAKIVQGYKIKFCRQGGLDIDCICKSDSLVKRVGVWIEQDLYYEENVLRKDRSYGMISSFLTILALENIVYPLLVKHGRKGKPEKGDEIKYTLSLKVIEPELFAQTLNPSYPKVVQSEQDIIDLLTELNDYIQQVSEPFFEKWSDLRTLENFVDNLSDLEVNRYFLGYGRVYKSLIYKLCNNPKFEEYFNKAYNSIIDQYLKNQDVDIAYKQWRDLIIDFKEILSKTSPIL